MSNQNHLRVLITGAAGQIAYSLLPLIGNGNAFGQSTRITLVMLDLPVVNEILRGVAMEISDCAFPLVREVVHTSNPEDAFKDIDCAILVGSAPRKQGQERYDLITINASIFSEQGKLLDRFAKKTVKVLVVGNPANTNCLICSQNAPSIPKQNFTCLTMLDHNRLLHQISEKGILDVSNIYNIAIFGNHSSTMIPFLSQARIVSNDGDSIPLSSIITDENWYNHEVIEKVRKRGGAVIEARKLSSAMSAARAVCDHLRNLFVGTRPGDWCSMGVVTDGSQYGISENIVYSFPVTCQNGNYEVVKNVSLSESQMKMLTESEEELLNEKNVALLHVRSISAM